MNPFTKVSRATRLFRSRYGQFRGMLLWLSFFQEKWLPPGGLFAVHIPGIKHPVFLRAHSSDVEAFVQIFCRGELDEELTEPLFYIIDAGANIGLASLFLINKYPNAMIDALEVSKDNIAVLTKNVSPYPNIRIIAKGLWGRTTHLRIKNPDAEPWAFQVEETEDSDPQGIPAIDVGELLTLKAASNVDLLKIDIEGAEASVFGSSDTGWLSHVKVLMIELHDHFRPGCRQAVESAVSNRSFSHKKRGEYHIYQFRQN